MDTRKATITGVRRGKGEFEGTPYDYTKVFVALPMDSTSGDALGMVSAEFSFGKSDNFKQFEGRRFPLEVEADFQTTANGKAVKTILTAVRAPKVA